MLPPYGGKFVKTESVLSVVTIEAEADMTTHGLCQVKSAHCTSPLNICQVCVCMSDVLQLFL